MNKEMWLKKWESGEIGFHYHKINPLLEKHYELLNLQNNSSVFIPLCGKSLDILYFLDKGHKVVGCELSPIAINDFFKDLGVKPQVKQFEKYTSYTHSNLTLFEADIFDLEKEHIGNIDAIYDRAALVALKEDIRLRYTKQLKELTNSAKQLILTCAYEQELHQKMPFSVPKEEIEFHYKKEYSKIERLESREIKGGEC